MTRPSAQDEFEFALADSFEIYADSAILRFKYLYPEITCTKNDGMVIFHNLSPSSPNWQRNVESEFAHLLYRERILSETMPIRKWILGDG